MAGLALWACWADDFVFVAFDGRNDFCARESFCDIMEVSKFINIKSTAFY